MGFVLFCVAVILPGVFGQEQVDCFGAGSVAGAAIGGFIAALVLVAVAYYLRKLYWKSRKGKHLVFSTDPESVKDEFAFDNPGFRQDERQGWQHDAPTLPLGGKTSGLHVDFVRPVLTTAVSKDDLYLQRGRTRRVKLWARDFTGLGLRCCGGAREGVMVHSVLRSGPAAAAGLQPGDKIKSIQIELTGTPLEDAVGIISLASPYPVELLVSEGGKVTGEGRATSHPLLRRVSSTGDVNTLEKEAWVLHPPKSPNTSHSNNSTLENKALGIKKIISDKIITSTTLERHRKEKKDAHASTLERENAKNTKMAKNRHSDVPTRHVEKHVTRHSSAEMPSENGVAQVEHAEMQKREYDPKRGMKFGIRVLPPNVPDDGVLKNKNIENGAIDKKSGDELDKIDRQTAFRHENEIEKAKPVVAKRREKMAPPIPNARSKLNETETSPEPKAETTQFSRNNLDSSGIKRDKNGIPQEIPSHMLEAARAARSNRKSSADLIDRDSGSDTKEHHKGAKKSKGKAPSPPEIEKSKAEENLIEKLQDLNDFLKGEKLHSSILHDSYVSPNTSITFNTSTPKANKTKLLESINFSQDDIDDIVNKPFNRRESDSLNNYYDESKSNVSSNQDVNSVISLNNSDKGSTTIELNNSDITIHSSPLNQTMKSSDDTLNENERKATSLGDLSRFEGRTLNLASTGTLERAQSLDISADDVEIKDSGISSKRKANSVVESTFFDSSADDTLPDMIVAEKHTKHHEPRLSLNITKNSAMEGLNTFQRNRLKKASEFGNLEDAIVKGSSSSLESDKYDGAEPKYIDNDHDHEPSDVLAKKIMDENLKVHMKLVSDFAKSTSDDSGTSDLTQDSAMSPNEHITYEKLPILTYDTNIPDDMKVSRNTYANSLERPKSEMMKKLLASHPILNVHVDPEAGKTNTPTPMTDASKSAIHHPDIVNFDLKANERPKGSDEDFVSNVRVGSNNSMKYQKSTEPYDNVVTVSTNDKPKEHGYGRSYTKSIEIGDPIIRQIPDVIEGIKRHIQENESDKMGRTVYMEPPNMAITMAQEPVQKAVTTNVAEDEYGNKVITQNVEKVSTQYLREKAPVPLQVEQITFGIMKNSDDVEQIVNLDDAEDRGIDKKILEEIKKQNPNMQFTDEEPAFTKTETIVLNTQLDEEQALALMDKIKNDPNFMSQKTPEELSQLGIKIIHDLEDIQHTSHDTVEVTKSRYSIDPAMLKAQQAKLNREKNHITEIQVVTPRTEKLQKEKSENRERRTSDEYDIINDFITNERHHTSKQYEKRNEPKKRHSDYDLPRNSHIKFRTATYESPKGTIVTSTDLENRRLSQLDQIRANSESKPAISTKPSNIPVKSPEKQKPVSSKIPIFTSQKSQENLDKNSLPRTPPKIGPTNISITSIKSSSKNPSGKL